MTQRGTHVGLLVASRASLSRRLLWPVEDSRRCFSALCTLLVTLCPPVKLPAPALLPPKVCGTGTGMGVARSAAMDRESRLATGFSLCAPGANTPAAALSERTSTEVMFVAMQGGLDAVWARARTGRCT